MALDTNTLKNDIKALRQAMESKENPAEANEYYASQLAIIIEKFVKSADVKVIATPGLIAVQGSPSAQANVSPIVIEGKPTMGGLS